MATIRAAHYGETEQRLAHDPIVQAMAQDLGNVNPAALVHDGEDETPRFEFMLAANDEYRKRGGTDGGHIGAVASAILIVLKERAA